MTLPTLAALKADIKRLNEEIEADNIERGYSLLPMPAALKVSDVWALEVHKRYWPDVQTFLADYGALILQAKQVVAIGESDELIEWSNAYKVASECHDLVFSGTCLFISDVFLKAAMTGEAKVGYAMLAEMIAKEVSNYPLSVHKPIPGDYDGNYEDYYEKKQEALQQWRLQRKQ